MKTVISLSAPQIYFHGTKSRFSKFSEYRPAFFTKSQYYAEQYGNILIKVELNVKHWFDTTKDPRAVEIFNEHFLTSDFVPVGIKPIKLGEPVHMRDADELWSYLSVPEYPAPHYDGIVVSESNISGLHKDLKDANLSYVPLDVKQIKVVK